MPDVALGQVFADRFNRLYVDAGEPTYDSVVRGAEAVMRPDRSGRMPRIAKQRITDWRNGKAPREFGALAAVLKVLIRQAHARRPRAAVEGLYEMEFWVALWEQTRRGGQSKPSGTDHGAAGAEVVDAAGPAPQVCPYRGLAAFDTEHAEFFFGRDTRTRALVERIDELAVTGGLLMLIAPSGAGKSSLLGAGLVPAIRAGKLTAAGSARWPVLVLTPGPDPLAALAQRLSTPGAPTTEGSTPGPTTDSIATAVPGGVVDDPTSLGTGDGEASDPAVRQVRAAVSSYAENTADPGARLVLIIDQFEELFTSCESEQRRRVFIEVLDAVSRGPAAPAVVVLGMRSDFYSRCLQHPQLVDALQRRTMVLEPMTVSELTEAITGPARAAGLRLEPSLAELIIGEAGARRGVKASAPTPYEAEILPLLSHALRATWQFRDGNRLTLAGYKRTGGIYGAVTQTAERALAGLDTDGRAAALGLLLKMTRVGEGGPDTRLRCATAPLIRATGEPATAERALEALVRARLVSVDATSAQITHEALLHAWPTLRKHIDRHRMGLLALQRLEDDAAAWAKYDNDPSRLYRGDQLAGAQQWAVTPALDTPSPLAQDFLDQAVAAREQAERERERRRIRDRRVLVTISILAVAGLGLATIAAVLWRVSTSHENDANFTAVAAQADRLRTTDTSLAALLDLTAYRMKQAPDVYSSLIATQNAALSSSFSGHNDAVSSAVFSQDRHTLATASDDGTVRLWNVTDPTQATPLGPPLILRSGPVGSVAFSPDGRTLAAGGSDNSVRLFNVTDPAHPTALGPPLIGHSGVVNSVAFSPDGRTLASGSADTTVILWNVGDLTHTARLGPALTLHTVDVNSVAFSPDGHTLATGSDDGTVRFWNVTDPAHTTPLGPALSPHSGNVITVAFSPDGHTLATGSQDGTVRLFNVTDPAHTTTLGGPLFGHGNEIWAVGFSPDGRTLASGSADQTVRLWNVTDPTHAVALGQPLVGHKGAVFTVAFSPDGHTLATGSQDHTLRLWNLPTALLGSSQAINSASFSPNGHTLATASDDGAVVLWNVRDPAHATPLGQPLTPHTGNVNAVAFSSDGHTLATAGDDGAVGLWNVTDPTHATALGPLGGHIGAVRSVVFSPDGHTLATAGDDNTVRLWNLTPVLTTGHTTLASPVVFSPDGRTLADATANPAGGVGAVAFSPDGRILACGSGETDVQLWDVTVPGHPNLVGPPLTGNTRKVHSVMFSPDGHTLATAGDDDTVQLFNVADPAHAIRLGAPLTDNTDSVNAVVFSPDGKSLASAGKDTTVRLWNVTDLTNPTPLGQPLTGHTAPVLTVVFSPDGHTLATGGEDHTARLWDLDPGNPIHRICRTTTNTLSPTEWARYVPGSMPYDPPCSPVN